MATRHFTIAQLAALSVPPDRPEDVEYSDTVLHDEQLHVLKYTAQRRCVFAAPDDGRTYAVEYEAKLDTGDFEVGEYVPGDHGWYGDTVEAVEVEEREVTITKWLPVD